MSQVENAAVTVQVEQSLGSLQIIEPWALTAPHDEIHPVFPEERNLSAGNLSAENVKNFLSGI